MNSRMVLKGDIGEIALEVLRYENGQALNIEDKNWLRAILYVQAGPLFGKAEFGMTTYELSVLCRELSAGAKTLMGGIRHATTEGNWQLNIDFERTGTAQISGVLIPSMASNNALHYAFESDPISLESAVNQLRHLMQDYPIKTTL